MTKKQGTSKKVQINSDNQVPNLKNHDFGIYKLLASCFLFLVTFFLLVSCYLFFAPSILAQTKTTIAVTPSIINIILSPGKIYSYVVSVKNLSRVPIPISAKIDTFTDIDGKNDYGVNSLSKWIQIAPSDTIIESGETKKFVLTVKIPKTVKLGGYYASIAFTPLNRQTIKKDTQVQSQIVILALANIGVPRASEDNGTITKWTMGTLLTNESLNKMDFAVKNLSLYHFSAKPILTFRSIFKKDRQFIIDEKIILPGRERGWDQIPALEGVSPGIYNANLSVSVGNGVSVSKQKIVILLPTYKVSSFGFILILILILFFNRKKIHPLRALMILLGKTQK